MQIKRFMLYFGYYLTSQNDIEVIIIM